LLVYSQQVFEWRREARAGHLALPADAVAATAGAVVRVAIGTDGALLTEVLRAVRAPA